MVNAYRAAMATAWALAIAASVWLAALLCGLLGEGMAQTYDTMLYARSMWGVAHGAPFNPVYGTHWFGIHANVVLLALGPLTDLMPSWRVLAYAQSVAFCVTFALVTRAAIQAVPRAPIAGLCAGVAIMASPLMINPFLFDARPDLIAVPLLVAAFLRAERLGHWDWRGVTCLLMAPLVREEFAVMAAAALIAVPLRWGRPAPPDDSRRSAGRPRHETPIAAADAAIPEAGSNTPTDPTSATRPLPLVARVGAALGMVTLFGVYWFFVRPGLADGGSAERADRAAADLFGGAGGGVGAYRATFALVTLGFAGGLALRGWRWWPAAVPGLVFAAATTKMADHALQFHYPMFATPALATASVAGLRAFGRDVPKRAYAAAGGALTLSVILSAQFGAHPLGARFEAQNFAHDDEATSWLRDCDALLDRIPDGEGAAVVSMFGARFADREHIWSLETLTAAVRDDDVPEALVWVAMDNNRFPSLGKVLVNRHGFQLVGVAAGRLGLFRRGAPGDVPPVLADIGRPPSCGDPLVVWPEAGLEVCDVRWVDERVVLEVARVARASTPPLAFSATVAANPTMLEIAGGLVDPATLPDGVAVDLVSRDRVRAPRVHLHLQDMSGRSYLGVAPGEQPSLGVEITLPAAAPPTSE